MLVQGPAATWCLVAFAGGRSSTAAASPAGHRTPWPGHHSDQTKDKFKDKPQPLIRLS